MRHNNNEKRDMYTEIAKIIEGGLQKDVSKVVSYAQLLANKMEATGEGKLASKIRRILEGDKAYKAVITEHFLSVPVDNESRLSIANILIPEDPCGEIVLSHSVSEAIDDFVKMIKHKDVLANVGLSINSSLLLYGPPGCGKTSIAHQIAKNLEMPIMVARLDSMISSLLGNTSKNLRKLFEYANSKPCVLFLDEFDAIAKNRKDQNEQGELKRVINSLLQNIDDYLAGGNILLAATNHDELLDDAIWRRFEKIIFVDKPGEVEIHKLVTDILAKVKNDISEANLMKIVGLFGGLSYSEIKKIVNGAITKSIIKDKAELQYVDIINGFFQYTHFNDYSEDALIKFMNENAVTQKEISNFFSISLRQVRNNLNVNK